MIQVGDRVSVLDEDLRGTVVQVCGGQATVEDAHGFAYHFPIGKLVPAEAEIYSASPMVTKDRTPARKGKNFGKDIDLHITRLHPNPNSLTPEERLFIQKEHLAEALQKRRLAGIKKFEIIHGLGEGVVQQMVYDYLTGRTGLDFHDKEILREQSAAVVVYLR